MGWIEGQFNPSELHDFFNQREDQAAEQRLRAYFFTDEGWGKLTERAKRCLVSADRDWFSGAGIRTEAIVSNLSIATEEILFFGLWKQLEKWLASQTNMIPDNEISGLKDKLMTRSGVSRLRVLADICKTNMTERYLKYRGFSPDERDWLTKQLPARIHDLYNKRNLAEHESEIKWARTELGNYYKQFLGIGQYGIIPRMCRILFKTD